MSCTGCAALDSTGASFSTLPPCAIQAVPNKTQAGTGIEHWGPDICQVTWLL